MIFVTLHPRCNGRIEKPALNQTACYHESNKGVKKKTKLKSNTTQMYPVGFKAFAVYFFPSTTAKNRSSIENKSYFLVCVTKSKKESAQNSYYSIKWCVSMVHVWKGTLLLNKMSHHSENENISIVVVFFFTSQIHVRSSEIRYKKDGTRFFFSFFKAFSLQMITINT